MSYITLEEAKDHCRVDYTDDDHYIEQLISVAETLIIAEVTGRVPGLGTVTTAATTALTGLSTEFLTYKAGDVILVEGETSRTISAITTDTALTVTSAFSTSSSGLSYFIYPSPLQSGVLPSPLKQAMLLLIGHFYNSREPAIIGSSVSELPFAIDRLIAPYKTWVCE